MDYKEFNNWQYSTILRARDDIRRANPTSDVSINSFDEKDFVEVLGSCDDRDNEFSYYLYGKLQDGRYVFCRAWLTTDWGDTPDEGCSFVSMSLDELIHLGMTSEERQKLNIITDGVSN